MKGLAHKSMFQYMQKCEMSSSTPNLSHFLQRLFSFHCFLSAALVIYKLIACKILFRSILNKKIEKNNYRIEGQN